MQPKFREENKALIPKQIFFEVITFDFYKINNKSKQPISTDNLIIFPSCILDGKYTSDTKYRFSSKNYFRGK